MEKLEVLVEGGKATAAPPLGPALGPMGVNIGQVIAAINQKTAEFKGMQVPVKIEIDKATKTFTVSVGTPPASALIKKEAGIEKGSGNPLTDKVADIRIEQAIKVAKMKQDDMLGKTRKDQVKEVIGTCQSMGVMVEGMPAHDAYLAVCAGKFDAQIKADKTELSAADLKKLEEEKKRLQAEIEKRKVEFETKAKSIVASMEGKTKAEIRGAMVAAKIPQKIIDEILPPEEKAAPGAAPGAAPAPAKK